MENQISTARSQFKTVIILDQNLTFYRNFIVFTSYQAAISSFPTALSVWPFCSYWQYTDFTIIMTISNTVC